jgi:hypothetical protein
MFPLPPDGYTSLPKTEHTGPHQIITVHRPLMKPSFKNYNQVQKNRLKTYVGIKVKLIDKTLKPADVQPDILEDPRYQGVSHVFDILDDLKVPERTKLRELLGKVLKQSTPIVKSKWAESTGEIVKGLIDMEVMFDTNTTYGDILNDLFT